MGTYFIPYTTYHCIHLHVPRSTLHIIYENNPNRILQRMVINCALFLPLLSNIIRKSLLVYYPLPMPPSPGLIFVCRSFTFFLSISFSRSVYMCLSRYLTKFWFHWCSVNMLPAAHLSLTRSKIQILTF